MPLTKVVTAPKGKKKIFKFQGKETTKKRKKSKRRGRAGKGAFITFGQGEEDA